MRRESGRHVLSFSVACFSLWFRGTEARAHHQLFIIKYPRVCGKGGQRGVMFISTVEKPGGIS